MAVRQILVLISALLVVSTSLSESTKKSTRRNGASGKIQTEVPSPAYVTLMIVRDPSVQQELELTGEQLSRVNAAIARVDEPLWVFRDTPLDQSGEKLDALLEQLRQGVKDALTEKQWSRLEQILLQARGFKALRSPDLQSLLDLTDDQVTRIQSIVDGNARVTANTNDKEKRAKNESKPLDQRSLLSCSPRISKRNWLISSAPPLI